MSHSYRKSPIIGVGGHSDKKDKRLANRAERRITREILRLTEDETYLPLKREVSNVWDMSKDGKMRFDPARFPQLLRK